MHSESSLTLHRQQGSLHDQGLETRKDIGNNPCDISGSTVILRSYENMWHQRNQSKENTNNDFIQQFVSSASPYSAILESITYIINVCCSVSAAPYTDMLFMLFTLWSERKQHICIHTLHILFTYVILSKMALLLNCWIKSLFLFSLRTKSILVAS